MATVWVVRYIGLLWSSKPLICSPYSLMAVVVEGLSVLVIVTFGHFTLDSRGFSMQVISPMIC